MHNIERILKYWTLCESVKFEKFKIDKDLILFEQLNQQRTQLNTYSFKKVYHSLIKVKDLVQLIYDVYNITDINYSELELINDDEYTFLACSYFDSNNNLFANKLSNDISIFINPIFYYLNNFETKNHTYQEYMQIFNNSFAPVNPVMFRYVPDTSSLIEFVRKYKNTPNNIFEFIFPINSTIHIIPSVFEEIDTNRTNNHKDTFLFRRVYKDLMSAIERKSTNSLTFVLPKNDNNDDEDDEENTPNDVFSFIEDLSKNYPKDYIYLYTSVKSQKEYDEILYSKKSTDLYKKLKTLLDSGNSYLISFVNNTTISTNTTLPFSKESVELIKESLITYLKLDNYKNLFCDEIYGNNLILSAKELESLGFHSNFYLDSLTQEPKYNGIKYLQKSDSFTDVQIDNQYKMNINKISSFPMARWFSEHSLYYSQQNIVNQFFDYFESNEIVSANGAAGTGKTTLIKDVVAEIIYKKASKLIECDFNIVHNGSIVDDFLGKYEMLVVSNNNFAVENISKELPILDKKCFDYLDLQNDFLLLKDISQKVFKEDTNNTKNKKEYFGLISTSLGNKKNISQMTSFLNLLDEEINNLTINIRSKKDEVIKDFNSSLEKVNYYRDLFSDIDSFHAKLDEDLFQVKSKRYKLCITIKTNRMNYKKLVLNKKDLEAQLNLLNIALKQNYSLLIELSLKDKHLSKQIEEYKIDIESLKYTKSALHKNISNLQSMLSKMSFFKKLFKYKFVKQVKANIKNSNNQLELMKSIHNLDLEIKKTLKSIIALKKQIIPLKIETIEYKQDIKDSESIHTPTSEFFSRDDRSIQLASFYALPNFKKAQARLFVNSLRVHELNLIINYTKLKTIFMNKFNTFDMTNSSYLAAITFVFPVVSSSLASAPKMLKFLDKVGVIICDESGQATVLSGYCFMNRTLNAITVGDPLQIEPIIEIFGPLNDALLKAHDIQDDIFDVTKSSVQVLSDFASNNGSEYSENRIGMPLKVHRRCISPIFDISNDISYDNQIFNVTPALKENDVLYALSESCWYNIETPASFFRGNISIYEKYLVDKFIEQKGLCDYDEDIKPSIYVISPFRDKTSMYKSSSNDKYEFGTLHTFQGKEADIVFLVLGGNTPGSRTWASQKANMLNVAATRAKKRFYVVGDYNNWSRLPYFNKITKHLGEHKDMNSHKDKIVN